MKPKLLPESMVTADLVRAELRDRRMTMRALAGLCGVTPGSLSVMLTRKLSPELAWRLERAFDFSVRFASPPFEFEARERCAREFGKDPRQLNAVELAAFCRGLGIGRPSLNLREAWFQALVGWLAAHPSKLKERAHSQTAAFAPENQLSGTPALEIKD